MLRPAVESDVNALADILFAASADDPNYPYRFPGRHQFPDDFRKHCRMKCLEYLDKSTTIVCDRPSISDPEKSKVVAFGVWSRPSRDGWPTDAKLALHSPTSGYKPPEWLANRARSETFRNEIEKAKKDFFDSAYTQGHMFLSVLVCHPDYQRQGAGTELTAWGITMAREDGLNTTLFASPMGFPLYKKLGFRKLGSFRVHIDGETESLQIPVMVLESGAMSR